MPDIAETEAAGALYDEGRKRMNAGDLDGAIEAFSRSAQMVAHFKTLELLGECHVRAGRLAEAIVPLAAATTLNDQVRAPALLAETLLRLGQREDGRRIALLALSRGATNRKAREVLRQTEDLGPLYDKG